ncbi:hypothetical protein DR864_08980 [Runella rosea]|uniref:Uncharacterized protein n=2 Tax=Runella rosea TaxID=2259595 RepID=A0A344TGT5_9BACT|nr:hypothetical protein DR864_08980 [Runella rosea]
MDRYSPEEFSQLTLLEYLRATYPTEIKLIDYIYDNQYKGILRRLERVKMKGEDVVQAYKYEIQLQEELAEEENSDTLVEYLNAGMADLNLLGFGLIESAHILFEDDDNDELSSYLDMLERMQTSYAYQRVQKDPLYIPIPSDEWLNQYITREPTIDEVKKVYMGMYNLTEDDESLIQKIYLKIYPVYKKHEILYKLIADLKKLSLGDNPLTDSLKVKITRKRDDDLTTLSQVQTAYFFQSLRESGVLLQDKALLSDRSLAESIHILTGYSAQTARNFFSNSQITEKDKEIIIKKLEEIKALISKEI